MEAEMAKDEAKWAYWMKQIKVWQASGLSRNAFCEREGLKPTTFDYWRPLILANQAEAKAVNQTPNVDDITLIPVKLAESHSDTPIDVTLRGQPLQLKSPSGWEIQLPSTVNFGWLINLLRRLA
jgi:hypothetical protein